MKVNRKEGFRIGRRVGYNQGYREGLEAGYETGFAEGKVFGYHEGFTEALCLEQELISSLRTLKELLSGDSLRFAGMPSEILKLLDKLEKIV
ncbi:MAG: hypothetical protein AB1510_05510 [Bacillota bacterium]